MKDNTNNFEISYDLITSNEKLNPKIQIENRLNTEGNNSVIKEKKLSIADRIILNSTPLKNYKNNNLIKSVDKNKRKGKLFKIINYSYHKNSLGSIPGKAEKILLNDNIVHDRFYGGNSIFNQIYESTPGVGSYNLGCDWILKNKSIKMNGKGQNRFPDSNNYLPSVGEYDLDKGNIIQKERDNLRYNSLYNRSKLIFNDSKNINDNFCFYDPKNLDDISKSRKNYNFCSYSSRNDFIGTKFPTLFDKINDNPGPGTYFNNEIIQKPKHSYYNNTDNDSKNDLKNNNLKKLKLLFESSNLIANKSEIEDKPSFIMKQNGNKRDNKVYNLEDIFKMKNDKEIIINESAELEKKLRENEKNRSSKNLSFNIKQNKELNKIKNILGNDNGKPDYFFLSPERWKNKKKTFKVPGPAYYFY